MVAAKTRTSVLILAVIIPGFVSKNRDPKSPSSIHKLTGDVNCYDCQLRQLSDAADAMMLCRSSVQ